MVYILLIPFDVFAAVRHYDSVVSLDLNFIGIQLVVEIYDLYFVCYVVMIYMCFVGLPFSYFYAEEVQYEEEVQTDDQMGKYQMKGMDSSESSEEDTNQDIEITLPGQD